MNDFKSVSHKADSSRLLARTHSGSHEVVYESFHDVDLRLAESPVFVSSHTVGDINGFEGDVALNAWRLSFDAFETPFPKEFDLLVLAQLRAP